MNKTPVNRAAYLVSAKARPLEVKSAPYTKPGPLEVVIRNHAVATNPLDYIKQTLGDFLYQWLKYPAILGADVAGEVVEVGKDVTHRFRVGDRVVGNSIGMAKKHNFPSHCGFQEYVVLMASMTSHIPDVVAYENAAVIPLGLSTAACALFQKDQLGLQHPTVPAAKSTGKTLLVWGGSTSVGCNAIQLARAAGYEVVSTSSPRNFDMLKRLGAAEVVDYSSPTAVQDLKEIFKTRTVAGALSIGPGAAEACMDILGSCPKGDKSLAQISFPLPNPLPTRYVLFHIMTTTAPAMIGLWFRARRNGVKSVFTFGDTLVDNEVGPLIYETFLPKALADGTFAPSPEPQVVGHGLENIQKALDLHKKGVSAKKPVVTL